MIGDMRSFVVAVALVACACGEVVKVPDAAVIDAYVHDSPMTVMCGAGEMNCNGTCANVMSSELYCGNCSTQCSPTQGCLNGTCVPANTSCARVKELDPMVMDGAFRNQNNSVVFYCDFTARKQYEFGLGQWNVGYAGYALMSAANFDAATKLAFIGYYNLVGGLQTLGSFTTTTCCITQPNNLELTFGAPPNWMTLAQGGTPQCNITYNGVYQVMKGQAGNGTILAPPLPPDFFTTNPVAEFATCGETVNAGIFQKVTNF